MRSDKKKLNKAGTKKSLRLSKSKLINKTVYANIMIEKGINRDTLKSVLWENRIQKNILPKEKKNKLRLKKTKFS